jgi:predicted GNAT family N-acyltransferase
MNIRAFCGGVQANEYSNVVLNSGSYAVPFYEKHGFVKTGIVYSGDEDIEMIKNIQPL